MHSHFLKTYLSFFLLTLSVAGWAQKTDKVFLKNGDVLTGEIKNMKFGMLKYDVTGPGKIDIKWEEIVKIKSQKQLQITMVSGAVLVTNLDSLFSSMQHVSLNDLVEIVRINERLIKRLDGNINLGFNYAKSSESFQFNLNSATTYRQPSVEVTLKVNSVLNSSSQDTVLSKKQDVTFDYYRKLRRNYYVNGLVGWQQNTELGLHNRFLVNGIAGKILLNSNQRRLLTGAGLSYNLEQSNESKEYAKNVEAVGVIQYKRFRYTTPKISLDAQYVIYPSISDFGRVRMDFQLNTKIEIFKDFNVGLVFYDLFDSRPPAGAVSKNDFGINFTIGYEFGK